MNDPSRGVNVYLVSERMKCDLKEALPKIEFLHTRLQIAKEVAESLQHLHDMGMMHRDVKPENVLVGDTHIHLHRHIHTYINTYIHTYIHT